VLSIVAILVQAEDARAPFARLMEDACTAASPRETRCRLFEVGGPVAEATAIATVTWLDGDHALALVQVTTPGDRARERRVEFSPQDPERERWKAVGFAVATLVGERADVGPGAAPPVPSAAASVAPPGPPAPSGSATEAPSAPLVPSAPPAPLDPGLPPRGPRGGDDRGWPVGRSRPLVAGLDAKLVTGLDGALLGGVEGQVGVGIDRGVELVVAAGTTFFGGGSPDQVRGSLSWLSGGPRTLLWGGSVVLPFLRLDVMVEGLSVEAKRGVFRDTVTRWRPAARAALDLELPLGRWVSLHAGVELGVRSGTTTVLVASDAQARLPVLRQGLSLGLMGRF
jgi:hypothetical protein